MSDTSQGPGWWLASDGKWYPPESAPPPPPSSPPPQPSTVAVPPTQPPAVGSVPPPLQTSPTPPPGKKPLRSRPVFWIGLVVVVLVLASGVSAISKALTGTNQPPYQAGHTWGKAHSAAYSSDVYNNAPDVQNGQGGYCADNDPYSKPATTSQQDNSDWLRWGQGCIDALAPSGSTGSTGSSGNTGNS